MRVLNAQLLLAVTQSSHSVAQVRIQVDVLLVVVEWRLIGHQRAREEQILGHGGIADDRLVDVVMAASHGPRNWFDVAVIVSPAKQFSWTASGEECAMLVCDVFPVADNRAGVNIRMRIVGDCAASAIWRLSTILRG